MTDQYHNHLEAGFGLYIHWPFCAAKCPYCDFNSHVRRAVDQVQWMNAMISEMRAYGARLSGRALNSIFFGGGTPSLMDGKTVAGLLDAAAEIWAFSPDIEITLEANPTSIEAQRFADYRAAGVNRLSMGAQALNDQDLKFLGRLHNVEEALAAFELARKTFERISFDLIYARPGQSVAAWQTELEQAISIGVDHLSLYQLTIEPETPFAALHEKGAFSVPNDDLGADLFETTQEVCDQAGLPAYEISNHAKPGSECRHNLIYWQMGDYVGIGPGAHGRFTSKRSRVATAALKNPEEWLTKTQECPLSATQEEVVFSHDQGTEYALMSLRLTEGLSRARYAQLSGSTLEPGKIKGLTDQKLVHIDGDRLIATPAGRQVLNHVIAELV